VKIDHRWPICLSCGTELQMSRQTVIRHIEHTGLQAPDCAFADTGMMPWALAGMGWLGSDCHSLHCVEQADDVKGTCRFGLFGLGAERSMPSIAVPGQIAKPKNPGAVVCPSGAQCPCTPGNYFHIWAYRRSLPVDDSLKCLISATFIGWLTTARRTARGMW